MSAPAVVRGGGGWYNLAAESLLYSQCLLLVFAHSHARKSISFSYLFRSFILSHCYLYSILSFLLVVKRSFKSIPEPTHTHTRTRQQQKETNNISFRRILLLGDATISWISIAGDFFFLLLLSLSFRKVLPTTLILWSNDVSPLAFSTCNSELFCFILFLLLDSFFFVKRIKVPRPLPRRPPPHFSPYPPQS